MPKTPKGKTTCPAICLKLAQALTSLVRQKQFVSNRPPSRQRYEVVCPCAAAVPGLVTELLGRGTCVSGEPAGVAGTMESPFSPGLPHRPDEDWGEWDLRLCQGGSRFLPPCFRALSVTGVDESCRGSEGRSSLPSVVLGEYSRTCRCLSWRHECKILPDWNYYRVWLFPLGKYKVMIWCGEYDVIRKLRAGWPWPPKRLQGLFSECAMWAMLAVECLCVYVHIWFVWKKTDLFWASTIDRGWCPYWQRSRAPWQLTSGCCSSTPNAYKWV